MRDILSGHPSFSLVHKMLEAALAEAQKTR